MNNMNPTIEQNNKPLSEFRQPSLEAGSDIAPTIEGGINQEPNIIPVTGNETVEAVKTVPVTEGDILAVSIGYEFGRIGEVTGNGEKDSLSLVADTALRSKMRGEKPQVD